VSSQRARKSSWEHHHTKKRRGNIRGGGGGDPGEKERGEGYLAARKTVLVDGIGAARVAATRIGLVDHFEALTELA